MSRPAALVPVKAFTAAKQRLAATLDDRARATLARLMAERVLDAAHPMPVFVACDDEHVAGWALARGAEVVWTERLDLNGSIERGLAAVRESGASMIVVAHADLPFAEALLPLTDFDGVTLVPDRDDDGTNVVCIPARVPFVPMYGPGSFTRHRQQALTLGVPVRIARRADLRWDVDKPSDLPTQLMVPEETIA